MNKNELFKKIIFIITLLMIIGDIVFLFIETDPKKIRRMVFSLGQLLLMMVVIMLPERIKKKWNLEIPMFLQSIMILFAFCGFVLGDVFDFYKKIPIWDSILHTFSGVILAYIGFVIIDYLVKRDNINVSLNLIMICISVVLSALACGALWEIGEYLVDDIFGTNNQQYMESTRGTLYSKKDVPLEGHEALADTMKDLMLDLAGALSVATIVYCKEDKHPRI